MNERRQQPRAAGTWPPAVAVLVLAAALLAGRGGRAEPPAVIHPLPPVDATSSRLPPAGADGPRALLASDPSEYRPPQDLLPSETPHLTAHKNTFFQKLEFTATEVLPDGGDGLGLLETELSLTLALPAPTTEMPLAIIPTLATTFVDSPASAPLPEQLYGANLDLIWLPKISPGLLGVLGIGTGWYSDFEGPDDGFRLSGRAIVRYDWVPERMQLVAGVLYINRLNTKLIPAAGVIWMPNDDLNFEMTFPQVKLGRRLTWGPGFENWVYLAGGFGGNSWSIRNAAGDPDVLDLQDWRLMVGWEQKRNGGAGYRVEIGYVFSREIEFGSAPTVLQPDDTLLLRGGAAF
ncbi:MAG: hypothetical protein GX575_03105 [Candidatus Anammoximicrobium sp.]|nr:hypothetical protein [Candidatus Anammoximicrobium sp.]